MEGTDILGRVFDLYGRQMELDAQAEAAARNFDAGRMYGVDEYGRTYQRGAAVGLSGSPVLLVGAGIISVGLLLWALRG